MNTTTFFQRIKFQIIKLVVLACLFSQVFITAPVRADQLRLHKDAAAFSGMIAGCPIFPSDNVWNVPIDTLPVHARSTQWIDTIGRNTGFHMDFGSGTWAGGPIGIPYNVVGSTVPKVSVSFYYEDESDPGPYPIPNNPLIEHGSDHHVLILDNSTCMLYELFDASRSGSTWYAGSGAIWDLNSNALRPDTWTSADAAGLPILPGLVRYDEILSGEINHAIRFTAQNTNGYIWPARHLTSNNPNAPQIPPMGARFRLRASYDISSYPSEMRVILRAMKTYGIILADNGSNWYVSGTPDPRWNNDMLHLLDDLTGDDFEAVDTSTLMVDYNSGATGSRPDAATLVSPAGSIETNNPTYTWNEVPGATSYYLWVDGPSSNGIIKQRYTSAQANCNGTICSVTPTTTLGGGSHAWAIQTRNSVGDGPWSSPKTFSTPGPSLPGAATLRTPSGDIGANYMPTYTWDVVPGATSYYLWVDAPSKSGLIKQWYTAVEANCNSTICSVTPSTTLGGGSHAWAIQARNSVGDGPWSSPKTFTTTMPSVPAAATLRTPSGDIGTNYNPTYTWDKVSGATSYYLWVDAPSQSGIIRQWYTAAEANCDGSTCSVTPMTTLGGGNHIWAIQARNSAGNGSWSSPKSFSLTPPTIPAATVLRSPSGNTSDTTPTYTWDEVPGTAAYYLWVDAPSARGLIKQWFTPAQASCNGTTCSVTLTTALGAGTHAWAVQTWNKAGYGPWSNAMNFSVP